MKLTVKQLRTIIREEVETTLRNSSIRNVNRLAEGHARITPAEMNAWMSGDWGYVSENDEEKLDDDFDLL